MINKLKKNKLAILELVIIFMITLLANIICNNFKGDEMWCYGFAHSIATGLLPYKDFNMILSPLIPIINAIFLIIFGKNVLVFHIVTSLVFTAIFYYMKKTSKDAYLILYLMLLPYPSPQYNVICILLLFILIDLEKNNKNDYLIGIILGLTFLTKQNIGVFLCIPTLFTKDIKKIAKRIAGFMIPVLCILIYLIYNNILYEYIDYTFLGLSDFTGNNKRITYPCLALSIIGIIYVIYKYIKTKDITFIYLLMFYMMIYPICDTPHFIKAYIPTLCYFLNEFRLNKKMASIAFTISLIFIFSVNIHKIYTKEYMFPNDLKMFEYRKIDKSIVIFIKRVAEYIENSEDKVYMLSTESSLVKYQLGYKINKYDMLNDGNLGKNGAKKLIDGIEKDCSNKNCTFLLSTCDVVNPICSQYNRDIINHIIYKYKAYGRLDNYELLIYKNH